MAIYRYKGSKERGGSKTGLLVAFNENDAERRIRRKGLEPVWLEDASSSFLARLLLAKDRIKQKDIVVFSREFSLLVAADVGLVESLVTIMDQTDNVRLRSIIADVAFDVDAGSLLSESLQRRGGKTFSQFYINVIKAGETSGKLEEVLNYLADEMEKDYDLLARFKGAMIYPALVVIGLVAVGVIMMVFVMPELTAIIQETGAKLPWATRVVIAAVDFTKNYLWLVVFFLILAYVLLRIAARSDTGKKKIDEMKLRLPLVGKLYRLVYIIRFCRSLSTLLKGGVTILRSLDVTKDIVRNRVYQDLIEGTSAAVSEGNSISYVFAESEEIPKMIPQMMVIGEKTGRLDDVLDKISQFYSRELNIKLNNLNAILEPAIMVVLGAGVAIMVAAIILPMYNVATSF